MPLHLEADTEKSKFSCQEYHLASEISDLAMSFKKVVQLESSNMPFPLDL